MQLGGISGKINHSLKVTAPTHLFHDVPDHQWHKGLTKGQTISLNTSSILHNVKCSDTKSG